MTLMSTLHSPKAQYALGDVSGLILTDRSGNNEHLTSFFSSVVPQPDLRVGFLRPFPTANYVAQKTGTYLRTLGAITVLCRAAVGTNALRRAFAVHGSPSAGEAANDIFDWAVATSGVLTYRHQYGTSNLYDTVNSIITPDRGHERFYGLRRSASGLSITFSYGDFDTLVHDTQTLTNAPTGGTSSTFRIGGGHSFADSLEGATADFNIWHSELSNLQVAAFWEESMTTDEVAEDTTPPAISNVSPPEGAVLSRHQAISFRVTDETGLASIVLSAEYPSGAIEVIYRSDGFTTAYQTSTRSAVSGGFDFTIRRQSGWHARPTVHLDVVDSGGNTLDE